VIEVIQADGTCWLGGTVVAGARGDAHQRLFVGDDRRRRSNAVWMRSFRVAMKEGH